MDELKRVLRFYEDKMSLVTVVAKSIGGTTAVPYQGLVTFLDEERVGVFDGANSVSIPIDVIVSVVASGFGTDQPSYSESEQPEESAMQTKTDEVSYRGPGVYLRLGDGWEYEVLGTIDVYRSGAPAGLVIIRRSTGDLMHIDHQEFNRRSAAGQPDWLFRRDLSETNRWSDFSVDELLELNAGQADRANNGALPDEHRALARELMAEIDKERRQRRGGYQGPGVYRIVNGPLYRVIQDPVHVSGVGEVVILSDALGTYGVRLKDFNSRSSEGAPTYTYVSELQDGDQ